MNHGRLLTRSVECAAVFLQDLVPGPVISQVRGLHL